MNLFIELCYLVKFMISILSYPCNKIVRQYDNSFFYYLHYNILQVHYNTIDYKLKRSSNYTKNNKCIPRTHV